MIVGLADRVAKEIADIGDVRVWCVEDLLEKVAEGALDLAQQMPDEMYTSIEDSDLMEGARIAFWSLPMIRFKSVLAPLIVCMTLSGSSSGGIRRIGEGENEERAALEGMLSSYPVEQLVEEVLTAWEELSSKNEELVSVKQRVRVLELDLAKEKMRLPLKFKIKGK